MLIIFLVYCIVSLFYYVSVFLPSLRDIFPTTMARCCLFVFKVPLNIKQTNFCATYLIIELNVVKLTLSKCCLSLSYLLITVCES